MAAGTPDLTGPTAKLLASRGCVAEAGQAVRIAADNGLIDQATSRSLQQDVARFSPAPLPPGHPVFDIFQDSIISSWHFKPQSDRGYAREAFRQAVRWIEIETSS